mmetsp:Transcript_60587/g.148646  ORF Transcript_60587/g.148646 Transcript_60587/m.148646 type:complete len:97 (-) Transcript_60587:97-387(-)
MMEIVSSVPSLTFRFGDKRSDVIQAKTLFFIYLITPISLDMFQSIPQIDSIRCFVLLLSGSRISIPQHKKDFSLDFVNQSLIFYYTRETTVRQICS